MAVDGLNTHSFITVSYNQKAKAKGLGDYQRELAMSKAILGNSGPRVPRSNGQQINWSSLQAQYAQYYDMSYSNNTKFDWEGGAMGAFEGGLKGAAEGFSSGGDWKSALIGGVVGAIGGLFSKGSQSA